MKIKSQMLLVLTSSCGKDCKEERERGGDITSSSKLLFNQMSYLGVLVACLAILPLFSCLGAFAIVVSTLEGASSFIARIFR